MCESLHLHKDKLWQILRHSATTQLSAIQCGEKKEKKREEKKKHPRFIWHGLAFNYPNSERSGLMLQTTELLLISAEAVWENEQLALKEVLIVGLYQRKFKKVHRPFHLKKKTKNKKKNNDALS